MKGEEQVAEGEVFGDGLGDRGHVEVEGVQFLEGEPAGLAYGPDDNVFIKDNVVLGTCLELEGDDNIDQVRETFVEILVGVKFFEEFLALLALFEGDELPLLPGE